MSRNCRILVLPEEREIVSCQGGNLLQMLQEAGVEVRSDCGGEGTCGRCRVTVERGSYSYSGSELPAPDQGKKALLACRTEVKGDLTVRVPESSRLTDQQVLLEEGTGDESYISSREHEELPSLQPLYREHLVQLEPPSLVDNTGDLERLYRGLSQEDIGQEEDFSIAYPALKDLAGMLRDNDWQVKVGVTDLSGFSEITALYPAARESALGIALDIGTTTLAASLFELTTGSELATAGEYNRQTRYGEDVISRINYAAREERGKEQLQEVLCTSINQLVEDLARASGTDPRDIMLMVCAGNTTMIHTLYALDPNYIRRSPYTPTFFAPPPLPAEELGVDINPWARVFSYPAVGSFVGADIVSGVLASGIHEEEELCLLVDIGTNGEIVVGNADFLMACSASAGPAFEGGGIRCGTRAREGAIEAVQVTGEHEVRCRTINDSPPIGICGTGLIDTLATLQNAGVINRSGRFNTERDVPGLRSRDGQLEYLLVQAEAAGVNHDIVLAENDIKHLMRSKAAVFAGIRMLLGKLSLEVEEISRVLVAGGFGNYLNIEAAIQIGLFPDLPRDRFAFIGNSSLRGARRGLLSKCEFRAGADLAQSMTYLELSSEENSGDFMEEFVAAQFIPHTDLSLFPSVMPE